ncbi:hypothetical protein [Kingella sp. (in: b-proteobacteria)]|uniref:hypothetical protein n=1 Tax=Kingella sp. (in: b-proteobacteria) TaxID=2020713 RepID=UPI0026DAFC4F|nr:hypothetical protein [Kingella sp. (in: b-proteobacteria)]MDO4657651.1 hypothetical protein [Kingella sp. (in: b-proteobacteria)]
MVSCWGMVWLSGVGSLKFEMVRGWLVLPRFQAAYIGEYCDTVRGKPHTLLVIFRLPLSEAIRQPEIRHTGVCYAIALILPAVF